MKTTPKTTNVNALRASCSCTSAILVRDGRVVCATCSGPIVAANESMLVHAQYDGERPVGAGRVKYKRGWHALRQAGEPETEVWRESRALKMTAAAWSRYVASVKKPTVVATTPKTEPSNLLAIFGARRAG